MARAEIELKEQAYSESENVTEQYKINNDWLKNVTSKKSSNFSP
jgi:hypothetical protein